LKPGNQSIEFTESPYPKVLNPGEKKGN